MSKFMPRSSVNHEINKQQIVRKNVEQRAKDTIERVKLMLKDDAFKGGEQECIDTLVDAGLSQMHASMIVAKEVFNKTKEKKS